MLEVHVLGFDRRREKVEVSFVLVPERRVEFLFRFVCLLVPVERPCGISDKFRNSCRGAETRYPEGTAIDRNSVGGKVVESVVRAVRERKVFAFADHFFQIFHAGIDGVLAVLDDVLFAGELVMAEHHQHIFRCEILPFLYVVPVIGVGTCVEGASEIVDDRSAYGPRAFEFRFGKIRKGMVHVFVVAPCLRVACENRIGKAFHHFAVESREKS